MKLKLWKLFLGLGIGSFIAAAGTQPAYCAGETEYVGEIGVETSSCYMLTVDAPTLSVYKVPDTEASSVADIAREEVYLVESYEGGWALISGETFSGYVKVSDGATLVETTQEVVDEQTILRNDVVEYALQFVGNPYVWGGVDPNTGADCSGFTMYVMREAAGVNLSHGSAAQSGEGTKVSEAKIGDLIFYSDGGQINHVAIYIGNDQVVHAATEKTGIKVSKLNHRKIAKIVDVLS